MLTTKFLPLAVLALALLALVLQRLFFSKRYSNVLGLIAAISFGLGFTLFDQIIAPEIMKVEQLAWINLDQLKKVNGALFWLSVAYFCNALVKHFVYPRRLTWEGDSKVPLLMQYLVTVLIYLAATVCIVGLIYGQSITGLITASGAVLLIIAYSARALIDEVFAGIAININAPFEKGDLIQLNDEWGYVKEVDWRSITYLDMDNNNVVVPNTKLAASKIRNLDRPRSLTRRVLHIRVEYNVPPKVVIDQCQAAMKECPHIVPHPWQFTSYLDADEKGLRYRLHFYVRHFDDWWLASDELMNAVWYRFARNGIRFAQQRKLNFTNADDAKRSLPDSAYDDATWRTLVERFNQVPMFEGMTPKDMEELARSAELHIIGPPEKIIESGSTRSSMFLIASGAADVYQVDENGIETLMATVGEFETLGLMALLTGSPQKTTIRAKEECAVWEIGSESLHVLFDRKPEIMEAIAKSVARWQAEEDDAINAIEMNRQQEKLFIQQRTNRLSNRIAGFFKREVKPEDTGEEYTNY
ncbi:MAG: small-conductance mechanosensitive channel/CRP-like cAMP-binding protein [Arenicella sp.]|jgi:small-conductance mechanosensitive channel/CRP-like cAMP-binding protein